MLLEPTSVVAKAWEHIERIGARSVWQPETVLVTGAGPIGLLAALLACQRGLDRARAGPRHLRRQAGAGPRARRAVPQRADGSDLGFDPDVVLECTGAPSVVLDVMCQVAPNGIVCLTGVSTGGRMIDFDAGALNRELVLENNVVFGSVNANRRHWDLAARRWPAPTRAGSAALITRRVPVERVRRGVHAPSRARSRWCSTSPGSPPSRYRPGPASCTAGPTRLTGRAAGRCGTGRRRSGGPRGPARRTRARSRPGAPTNPASSLSTTATIASSVEKSTRSWLDSSSATECIRATARPRSPTTPASSSGSLTSDQSRSAAYGDTSATSWPTPSSSVKPSHGSACACSARCDSAVRWPWCWK